MFFRKLTPVEERTFRKWARDNYEPGSEIRGTWHPVVQDECVEINRRRSVFVPDASATREDVSNDLR